MHFIVYSFTICTMAFVDFSIGHVDHAQFLSVGTCSEFCQCVSVTTILNNFEISFEFKIRFELIIGTQNWVHSNIRYRCFPVNHIMSINVFFYSMPEWRCFRRNIELILVCNPPHIWNPRLKALFVKMKGFVISTPNQHTIRQVFYYKKPWLSEGLKLSIKHKNKLYHKNLKCKTAYNEVMYKTYRNKLTHVLAKAEKDHNANLLEANKSNMKKTWGILKDIINKNKTHKVQSQFKLNDGSITSNKLIISEQFNDFFINIGPTLADKIPKQSKIPESYLGSRIKNSILLAPVTLTEIDDIFKTLRRCTPGYDELTTDIISLSLPCIKNPLLHIMNQSLLQGVFPNELKVANVIPLYKADDPLKFNNYRPVSLLSILSKIFKKAMYNRLTDFLETQKLLMEKQFGFRKDHSTYMALMLLVDNLIKSLENGEYVLGVF